jgi:hypothetical protein
VASRGASVHFARSTAFLITAALLALMASACGGDDADPVTATLTVHNETACILHLRFDNGAPKARIQSGTSAEFTGADVAAASYVKLESTMAIFRTFAMADARVDEGRYEITVRPAADDRPCVER